MYKVLGVSNITARIISFMPQETMVLYRPLRLCSYCNFYHRNIVKFTTIAITNKKTAMQKLSAARLSILVQQPNVVNQKKDIGHLHNKDDNNPKVSNSTVLKYSNEFDDRKEAGKFIDPKSYIETDDKVLSRQEMDGKSVILQDVRKVKEHTEKNLLAKGNLKKNYNMEVQKEEFCLSLISYIQTYIDCGLLNVAHSTLKKIKKKKFMNNQLKYITKAHNLLINAYIKKGEFDAAEQIYISMKTDKVLPDVWTYAYMLICHGKNHSNENRISAIQKIQESMGTQGITIDNIFNILPFKEHQWKYIWEVIKLIQPAYVPPDIDNMFGEGYKCKLVQTAEDYSNVESPVKGLFTEKEMEEFLQKQLNAECQCEVKVHNIATANMDSAHVEKSKNNLQQLEEHWMTIISQSFDKNLKYLKQKETKGNRILYLHPILEKIDKNFFVDTVMREIRQLGMGSEGYSAPLVVLYEDIGRQIYKKFMMQRNKETGVIEQVSRIYMQYIEWYLNPENDRKSNNRVKWNKVQFEEDNKNPLLSAVNYTWTKQMLIDIGRFLYHIILNDVKFKNKATNPNSIPAFYTLFRTKLYYLVEEVKPHPFVSRLYKDAEIDTLLFPVDLLPSYAPPRPWTTIWKGGYIITPTKFMRITNLNSHEKLVNSPNSGLFPVFDSLNCLAAIPWKINTAILDLAIQLFRSGGSEKLDVPRNPSLLTPPPVAHAEVDDADKLLLAKNMMKFKRLKAEMYSLWCDCLYRLSMANHFRDKTFWLPHNIDFRGRAYPVPPHLTHLSSDLSRSLLLFAQGKPLGCNGFDWLKLHAVNLTGQKKKSSVAERLAYANEILDDILDSAEHPLTGRQWWTTSDEPWQTLATCMEIAKALKSSNPEEFVSNFPIHQDGSCNGLQHYAALGRDVEGAQSVNLNFSETPQDVYSAVVATVEAARQKDAEKGVQIANELKGHVTRKVIKQTVMTSVYGVTRYGARLQIIRQLKDIGDFPPDMLYNASAYLTDKTFISLRSMFKSAREIQDWLTDCARFIAHTNNESVQWVTPLGLPIIQPYVKITQQKSKPDLIKQKNAFPPNFIHSLDSTHMMLTSLYCFVRGITFVSVHDCFWTHATTVAAMNVICREQFISLHTEPILEDLSAQFIENYVKGERMHQNTDDNKGKKSRKNIDINVLKRIPKKGNFDVRNVISSIYFFS